MRKGNWALQTAKFQIIPQYIHLRFCLGSGHRELAEPAPQKALEKSLGPKDQSCPMLRLSHKAVW